MSYIKGFFVKDIYQNFNNGYLVGLFRVKESDDIAEIGKIVTFTGVFDELKYKMQYIMHGDFVSHSKYGRQFQVNSYEVVMPSEKDELVTFLSSDLFPIGEKTALKIVEKLGSDAISIIVNNPDSLSGIARLTESKIEKIRIALSEYETTSKLILSLNKLGFNTKDSTVIIKKYHQNALDIIMNNIYEVEEVIDIPFSELDKIALSNNYDINDERRLLSLTIHLMKDITFSNGSTYLYFDEIYQNILKHTENLERETMEYILLKLSKLAKIVIKKDNYYLKELYDSENYIADRLTKLTNLKHHKLPKLEHKIQELELVNGITYDESQKIAIKNALSNNLTIITGGPGTGKTTIIKCIVKLLLEIYNLKLEKLALLAPTGRAAKKLMETTGIPAYTIHKYLRWNKEQNIFEVDEYSPNKEEYIIVDESSMIDTNLMSALLKGTTYNAKYIFIGDYYQLPSVSQGQVLKDMIDSNCFDVIKLNRLYRQTEDSYIATLAYEIKNKELNDNYLTKYDDYNFIKCSNDNILKTIENIIIKATEKGYTEKDIQVLAPIYKSVNGIDALNKLLQNLFNPKSPDKNEITSGDTIYREGDKILQLTNDPDNGISNGDIGYIESIITANKTKSKKNEIVINYDGNYVTYTPKDFINIMHGYAISVHKAQGSEFKMVIIPFSKSYSRMLYNKLIYTAITRARDYLILVGDVDAFIYGIKNDSFLERKTTLKELIENKYK